MKVYPVGITYIYYHAKYGSCISPLFLFHNKVEHNNNVPFITINYRNVKLNLFGKNKVHCTTTILSRNASL